MRKRTALLISIVFLLTAFFYHCEAEELTEDTEDAYGVEFNIPFYFQWDPRWGNVPYGTGVVGNVGCGPTCMSMVALYLTDNVDYTPEYVSAYCDEQGLYVPGAGTSWELFASGAAGLQLSGTQISLDVETMRNELLAGHPIILSMGAGDFTSDGHFIVIRGFNEEGFLVNDPNSPPKTLQSWSGSLLISQAAAGWSFECIEETEIRYDLLPGLDEETLNSIMGTTEEATETE